MPFALFVSQYKFLIVHSSHATATLRNVIWSETEAGSDGETLAFASANCLPVASRRFVWPSDTRTSTFTTLAIYASNTFAKKRPAIANGATYLEIKQRPHVTD